MKLLTTKDIAELLKVKPITVQRMCANGDLPALKLGKSYRIDENEFYFWLNKKRKEPIARRLPSSTNRKEVLNEKQ